ncbi:MAG: 50S ribosomal protein L18e [Candidatus Nanoarchaeia archaeon]|nr:50S ribosomal protein L18e [Candidatus Nanoarchaeia archaeon]MDD5239811.1 50S ribosomal protein L18e [Candidatus Nanoarchaeia archaeon]
MKSETTNPNLKNLIISLKKAQKDVWTRIASDLAKPRRQRRTVNLSRINRYCAAKEIALVPGKVLGDGELTKKLTVAALNFSDDAKLKIEKAGGKTITITELLKTNPDAKGVRILG